MGDPYVLMLVALAFLAIIDLVVGVSNDAVNFLNSAIGSKAISIKKIMIIASIGVFFGAATSSGMMEVARKGIFVPGEFYFNEIMYIFMAVMITDILLLDVFNSLGLPTSTTVSIVFELLGAAVAMALIKISANDSQTVSSLFNYINSDKATEIIIGILLSVVIAFSIGAIVQYFSRIIFSFNFNKRPTYISALFGGFAITAITYFIIIKGLKGTSFSGNISEYLDKNIFLIIVISFLFWTIVSHILVQFFKTNIFKLIIIIGTFSLAMAFSGNDLVNFIGVPVAALNSYDAWQASGVGAESFSMEILAKEVPSNMFLLLLAGAIMVITLWTSKKARKVIDTGINLSRQGEGHEKFQPNAASRLIVRIAVNINKGINLILPKKTQAYINTRFEKPVIFLPKDKTYELPAFDMIRATVNLIIASVLISIGTSLKLPLSTTYVTFMVAMGTSLADRAWGRESAVYRVAGVINVIGGWFVTAILAFSAAALFAYLISLGGIVSVAVLLIFVVFVLVKSFLNQSKKEKEAKAKRIIKKVEILTIKEVINESTDHISEVIKRVNKLYANVVKDLSEQNINKLKKTDKHVNKLNSEIENLRGDVFYFIKSLDETSVEASRFYILILAYLQDLAQSISYISKISYKHVSNNHKALKRNQVDDLKQIDKDLHNLLGKISGVFETQNFEEIALLITEKQEFLNNISKSIEKQISRIRTEETSPKNATLYFSILLETKDLTTVLISLLELYQEFYFNTKKNKKN